ncbi:hypothetical protein PPACK8108_LOCUS13757 [Phakopsora pachyrhizi]|uniref:Uncharacterized protein n=1 Tax=Phakopsora pachyrhizi TaxID=170000 RepID=A0AAV0B6R6_PHAPC|nr:hypothetical protein PPACK8108_LOCUS13757 [Phakopsora pachyrhizi]
MECHTKLKIKENFLKRAVDEKFKQIEQMIRFISFNEFDQQQIGNMDDYKRPLNGSLKKDESSIREDYSSINDLGEDRAGCDPRRYAYGQLWMETRPEMEGQFFFGLLEGMAQDTLRMGVMEEEQQLLCSSRGQRMNL